MRTEKKYLIEEVARHLKKSDYLLITNYQKVTVADVAALRARLAPAQAEFHVVKNSSLRVAAQEAGLPGQGRRSEQRDRQKEGEQEWQKTAALHRDASNTDDFGPGSLSPSYHIRGGKTSARPRGRAEKYAAEGENSVKKARSCMRDVTRERAGG